jgi:uncharacterized CHY-type Zn-finger protein
LTALFLALVTSFLLDLWGNPARHAPVPLVDLSFIETNTARLSAADLIAAKADTSQFECYVCHDKAHPVKIKYDAQENIILPAEHQDLKMGHGRHNRNNNCFNCHNEKNLEVLQTRDGRELKVEQSPQLCGSCHGPTYRDWEAGVHGRTSGYWNRALGPIDRKTCPSCHDPHSPKFPPRKPAPGPHILHALSTPSHAAKESN